MNEKMLDKLAKDFVVERRLALIWLILLALMPDMCQIGGEELSYIILPVCIAEPIALITLGITGFFISSMSSVFWDKVIGNSLFGGQIDYASPLLWYTFFFAIGFLVLWLSARYSFAYGRYAKKTVKCVIVLVSSLYYLALYFIQYVLYNNQLSIYFEPKLAPTCAVYWSAFLLAALFVSCYSIAFYVRSRSEKKRTLANLVAEKENAQS